MMNKTDERVRVIRNQFTVYEYNWICPRCCGACEEYAGGREIEVLKCDACGTEIGRANTAEGWEVKGGNGKR
jgi:hypothetical protein